MDGVYGLHINSDLSNTVVMIVYLEEVTGSTVNGPFDTREGAEVQARLLADGLGTETAGCEWEWYST